MKHLEKEVRVFRQRLSQNPQCQRTGAILLKKEELLNAYEKSHQEKLQEWLGLKAELDGEVTMGFLSGKIKERKARTEVKSVCYNGTTHSGAREVLTAATEYFRNSFGGGDTDSHGTEPQVMDRVLCDASHRALGAPWSEEEVRAAVRELAPGKSPGQDGLPKELFEHNWDLLGPVLMQFIESFTRTAKLPREVSTAVTILLHKKGSKEELGNYRPITLLSTVYKVLAKVLASRLKKVLHEVISEDQAGFLPGRRLADAAAVVADAIEAGASDEKDWYLLMVDFQKAFDSISRAFLFRTLRGMGVPERFVSWAEGLHTGAGTRLHINGWTGERVAVEKGVRQGCPLAPYLFLCAVEPLCQDIARRRLGVGEKGAVKLAYLGYADDTSLVLQGEEQLVAAADVLEKFGKASGLKLNKDKTVVFPLGRNRGKSSPSDLQFKWADTAVPERLLGVWITPNGDPLPSWEKALDRARKELAKWEIQHLTTSARVTIINGYITPIFMFQAYIYPPPEGIWTKVKRICHHFVSGGEATEEKAFVLWNYELVCTPREEGGLGMICPKKRFDSIAVQNVGRMMLQTNPVKKWLTERAAAMPLGPDTIYAHQSLLKHWEEGSKRWKDMMLAFWKSPFCVTPEPSNRWEAEREQLAFNRRIPFRGASPFGNQQGSAKLLGVTLGDLVWRRADGSRERKCVETLTCELGSVDTAKLALKAFMAAPAGWRDMILATLTSEELVAKVPLLRYQGCISAAPSLWNVSGAVSGRVTGVACRESKDGTFTVGDGKYPVNFGLHSGEPVAAQGDKVLGLMGEARTKLLQSKLTKDGGLLALKEIRKELVTSAGVVKEQRRWIGDGRIIEWERVIKQRDSLATPARAREILLRLHCRNLQVGERLFFMKEKVVCPHCKAEETPEHCLLGCPAIQRIVRFLKKGLAEMNPQLSWQGLEDLLFMQRSTKSGFPESSFIATTLHQTWLARCDASRCGVALQPKKVIRLAVVKFVAHARVYCLARQMAARKHGVAIGADNWDYLATDEAAMMRRICSKGEFGQLVLLEKLYLKDLRQLTHLPETFGQLISLRELKLLECRQLQQLPDSLSQLSSLEHLEFNDCPCLTVLPDDMGKGLRSLRHLHLLECTALTHLPPSFSALTSLETLKIVDAKRFRGALLDGFGCLKSLKELSLESMPRFSSLPCFILWHSFTRLPKLEKLEVIICKKLTRLPASLLNLPTLRECDTSECPLLSRRNTRGIPARREEGEEGEGEEEEEGGDAEEEEGEEGGDVAGEREEADGEAPEDEESGGEDNDIEHEYAMDSDYEMGCGRGWEVEEEGEGGDSEGEEGGGWDSEVEERGGWDSEGEERGLWDSEGEGGNGIRKWKKGGRWDSEGEERGEWDSEGEEREGGDADEEEGEKGDQQEWEGMRKRRRGRETMRWWKEEASEEEEERGREDDDIEHPYGFNTDNGMDDEGGWDVICVY
ncbi:unnamed protein product [Closterium sp. NIES-65]|nr:unnamed protein product [Closterium sp. NIES-65]